MKLIILCGGMGTRLREETSLKPKPMVEIGRKPIIWHIMKHYSYYGFNEFILALGYKGDVIKNYFLNYHNLSNDFTIDLASGDIEFKKNKFKENWKITLVDTGNESMTGFRTKLAGKYITEDRFMLTYGDAVSSVNIENLVSFHKKKNTIGTITGVFPPSRFGDIVAKKDIVISFKEKERLVSDKNMINGGYFIFKKEFLDFIPNEKGCDLEKMPLEKLTESNQLSVFRHSDYWQCMDTYRDFLLLNNLWKNNPPWKLWDE